MPHAKSLYLACGKVSVTSEENKAMRLLDLLRCIISTQKGHAAIEGVLPASGLNYQISRAKTEIAANAPNSWLLRKAPFSESY